MVRVTCDPWFILFSFPTEAKDSDKRREWIKLVSYLCILRQQSLYQFLMASINYVIMHLTAGFLSWTHVSFWLECWSVGASYRVQTFRRQTHGSTDVWKRARTEVRVRVSVVQTSVVDTSCCRNSTPRYRGPPTVSVKVRRAPQTDPDPNLILTHGKYEVRVRVRVGLGG